jgi:LemA protein
MWFIWAAILIVIALVIGAYNKLVSLKNSVENSEADMDVQMKMRFDLVENLVSTVKGYATHESVTFEKVTQARTQFMNATWPAEKAAADNMISWALKSLFAVSESYPELKANTNFLQLQTELSNIENQIAGSRRYYNATLKEYNDALMSFPSNIIANSFGFKKEEDYFNIANEQEKQAPKVQF